MKVLFLSCSMSAELAFPAPTPQKLQHLSQKLSVRNITFIAVEHQQQLQSEMSEKNQRNVRLEMSFQSTKKD